jgi:hypothetical protein
MCGIKRATHQKVLDISTPIYYGYVNAVHLLGRGQAVEFACRRRTPRYALAVDIEVTDIQADVQIKGRTNTLSRFGCGVDAEQLLPKGTRVRIKLSHNETEVKALARIVYSSSDLGMGLAFTIVEPQDEVILEWWVVEFRSISVENP